LFVSADGEVSARLSATYDALLTQRLVLQPRLDVNAGLQDVPKFGVGSGYSNVELGLRLRYEIKREFAPHVGVTWSRQLGATANLARASGATVDQVRLVAGVRLWW
jgi:copper resistance protein B